MANPIPAPGALPPATQPFTGNIPNYNDPNWGYSGVSVPIRGYQRTVVGGGSGGGYGGGYGGGAAMPQYGLAPGSPGFQATQGAYDQQMQAAQQALARLAPGMFLGSGYGGGLGSAAMQRYMSPGGFDPAALAAQRSMLGTQAAGALASNQRLMQERASASGFGDSMGLIDAQSRAQAQNAADLQNALNALMMENERAKLQQSQTAGSLLSGLAGAEADYGRAYAQSQMERQFPVIPGVTPGSTSGIQGAQPVGGAGGYWSQSGRYMSGSVPYDPFANSGRSTPGGYTPQAPRIYSW
jgi:hypothetical protein